MHGFLNRGALKGLENYIIPLAGQKIGEHEFNLKINDSFIEAFEDSEIQKSNIEAKVKLRRTSHTFEFRFNLKGIISTPCDRCLEAMDVKVKHKAKLVVKLADKYEEINEELITIREEDSDFDLAPILYEYLKLSIPIRKVHKKDQCDPNMINMLDQFTPEEEKTDPRWDDLKKLLNNN